MKAPMVPLQYPYVSILLGCFSCRVAENVAISDVLEPLYVPQIVNSLFPLNEVCNHQGVLEPLFAVQVTELVYGLFIGCSMNHVVGNGSSCWLFINSWSEISLGFASPSRMPGLKRWFPTDINFPIRISSEVRFCVQEGTSTANQKNLQERIFSFRKDEIAKLKLKANTEMGTTRISSLQAVLAHLWRSYARASGTDEESETTYSLPVSVRVRLRPALPLEYFGNAIQRKTAYSKVRDLLQNVLGWAALKINEAISKQTDEETRKNLKSWVDAPNFVRFVGEGRCQLLTSSSPLFNVYGNDFGWGRPVAVRSGPSNKCEGMITLYEGVEDGGMDVEICSSPECLQAIGNDEEVMKCVTSEF